MFSYGVSVFTIHVSSVFILSAHTVPELHSIVVSIIRPSVYMF